jgi:hypothetical protein
MTDEPCPRCGYVLRRSPVPEQGSAFAAEAAAKQKAYAAHRKAFRQANPLRTRDDLDPGDSSAETRTYR